MIIKIFVFLVKISFMEIAKLGKDGPVLINPKVFKDGRGYFFETFNEKEFKEKVADVDFVQDNESLSSYGVIRGLHFQKGEHAQAKLVRAVKGAVVDVVVDIRPESPDFGSYYYAYLSEENHRQFFVPRGFAHGFLALRDNTVFQYKCDNFYCKESEGSIFFGDASLNIPWTAWADPVDFLISEKDNDAPLFSDYKKEIGWEDTSNYTKENLGENA